MEAAETFTVHQQTSQGRCYRWFNNCDYSLNSILCFSLSDLSTFTQFFRWKQEGVWQLCKKGNVQPPHYDWYWNQFCKLHAFDFTCLHSCLRLYVLQALLEFLSKVVSREKRNRMNLWAVATIMAPNLFLHKAIPSRLTEGAEKGHAEKAADVMRLLIRYQDLLWTVGPPTYSTSSEDWLFYQRDIT